MGKKIVILASYLNYIFDSNKYYFLSVLQNS